jgi:hypothetical protein
MSTRKIKAVLGNWRVLIRFSLDYDSRSSVRNAIVPVLTQCGIVRTKTGTWQSEDQHCSPAKAARQLGKLLEMLKNPQKRVNGAGAHAMLDHIWFYIERIR